MNLWQLARTFGRAVVYWGQENLIDLVATAAIPGTSSVARQVFGPVKSAWFTSNLWASRTVDGGVVGGMVPTAGAKYTVPKGLPKPGQRALAIENEPHTVDGFNGEITEGYGKGMKKLLADERVAVKIGTKTLVSRMNYHEHDSDRAGLHYDLVVEDVPSGTPKWELNIPRGEYKGRYAFVATKKGTIVVPMADEGLALEKPDYTLRPETFLERVRNDNAQAIGKWMLSGPTSEIPQPWIVEQKLDGSLCNVLIKDNRAIFRSHRPTGETYYDRIPHLESLANRSPVLMCRVAFPGPRLDGTVLKVEAYHPDGAGRVGGIFNALPDKAREIQDLRGPVKAYCWDVVKYRGKDVSRLPYVERRAINEKIISDIRLFNRNWHSVPICKPGEDPIEFYRQVISRPLPWGEGVVIKDANAPAGGVWFKVKQTDFTDLIVEEIQEGKGKYANSVGRMVVRNPDNQALGEVGSFAITDQQRNWIWQHRDQLVGATAKIRVQEMTHRGAPRAGVFMGWHEGKGSTEAGLLMYAESLAGGDQKKMMDTKYALIAAQGWRAA